MDHTLPDRLAKILVSGLPVMASWVGPGATPGLQKNEFSHMGGSPGKSAFQIGVFHGVKGTMSIPLKPVLKLRAVMLLLAGALSAIWAMEVTPEKWRKALESVQASPAADWPWQAYAALWLPRAAAVDASRPPGWQTASPGC